MKYNKISVIVPEYNSRFLYECIESLIEQDYPKEHYEIIVVDNGSDDEFIKGLSKYKNNIKLVEEKKRGSYCCRNKGIDNSSGDIVAFTDSDCIVDSNWIKNINRVFEKEGGKISAVQGVSLSTMSNVVARAIHEAYNENFQKYINSSKEGNCLRLDTRNCAISKKKLNSVGKFNENMFFWGDAELGERINENNGVIKICKEMNIIHRDIEELDVLINKRRKEGKVVAETLRCFGSKYTKRYFPEMLFIFLNRKDKQEKINKAKAIEEKKIEFLNSDTLSLCKSKEIIKNLSTEAFVLGVLEAE